MRFRHHHLGRVLAVIGLTAGSLASTAAGRAAADVVEPFGERYGASLYGDFTTLGNTVMGCPAASGGAAAPGGPGGPGGPGASGASGATGTSGATGASGVLVPSGASGASGVLVPSGASGASGGPEASPATRNASPSAGPIRPTSLTNPTATTALSASSASSAPSAGSGPIKPIGPDDPATRCAAAARGQGPDGGNAFVMRRTDAAGVSPGFGSSSGHVRIPAGAEVAYARLFWGGNDGTHRGPGGADLRRCDLAGADVDPSPGDPATTAPVLRIGSGPTVPVRVDSMVTDPADSAGAHFYTGESDVTAAFAGVSGTDARVTVGNVWAAGGKGCAAGWSLTVVHRFPGPVAEPAPVRRTVSVYGGHVVQRPDSPATTVTVDGFRRGAGPVRAGVVAFGGDRNAPGDVFRVDGRTVTEGRTGDTDNFFVGGSDGALDPRPADSLGVDAKEFVLPDGAVPQGATSAELSFATRGDTFVPAGLAFSVPVPDLEITRTASPREVRPGDVLTYTVTARNTGPADLPAVRFSDDLTGVLDDADHRRDARTDLGTVTYTKHGTAFSGALPAGRTATVTYSVRIKDRPEGDGRLRSGVTSETPRSNCGPGSVDPACATAPALTRPAPPRAAPTQAAPPRTLPTRTAQARPAAGDGKNATPAPPAAAGPASPAPPAPGPRGNTGSMAATGGHGERLWLLGALGLALAATGLVAKAALRGRRDT